MEKELNNTVTAVGNYNEIPTMITSLVSVVTMISGITITKTADKQVWADGDLTYTIVVSNNAEKTYATPEIKDVLDSNLVEFIPNSVTIDNVQATEDEYKFNEGTNTLTINLKDIDVGNSKTITFKVRKKS